MSPSAVNTSPLLLQCLNMNVLSDLRFGTELEVVLKIVTRGKDNLVCWPAPVEKVTVLYGKSGMNGGQGNILNRIMVKLPLGIR